ncbi:MAG: FAD-dependent monooxygenase [Proteobacteria bacterium]|nr:FAD-dependent monooxygenase [Pseudomonadota bacterium]
MKTDILIVGAGPTGLMMACQLLRFGINFRIIDQQSEQTNESRAFGIQARSMEIFDNLDLAEAFLRKASKINSVNFYINGQHELKLNFNSRALATTPFPHIYLLPQSETEQIFIDHLKKNGIDVERDATLEFFEQTTTAVVARINKPSGAETVKCQYLLGCDGAHSTVRKIAAIPFEGGEYTQMFFLADAKVIWPKDISTGFNLFFDQRGLLLQVPLTDDFARIIGASVKDSLKQNLDLQSITQYSRAVSHTPVIIKDIVWMAPFRLHHRVVRHYQKDRVFLLGDAAHIHSPVGAQGMNTGLQDAANLAWKLALRINALPCDQLLKTYQLERQDIGRKLTRTTDRLFSALTSPNLLLTKIRPRLIRLALKIINQFESIQYKLFRLASQLGISYSANDFVVEDLKRADVSLLLGPKAGARAPDAILNGSSLFQKFKNQPFNILLFFESNEAYCAFNDKIELIKQKKHEWIEIHVLVLSEQTQLAFHRYGVTRQAIYLIRPDGYVGFRTVQLDLDALNSYLAKLFLKVP